MTAALLYPLTILYRAAIFIRDIYWNSRSRISVPARVISVGGLTAGGSGKTSIVAFIASKYLSESQNAAVVARGYRRIQKDDIIVSGESDIDWEDCGDEPLVLVRSISGLEVYVSSDKTAAASRAAEDGHDPVIIDDGFQHRKLKRDVDIVCLDGKKPFGNGMLLPSGRLREPAGALHRADIIIIMDPDAAFNWRNKLPANKPVFRARKIVTGIKSIDPEAADFSGRRCLAFCGLGNPESFMGSLEQAGYRTVDFIKFRDHHRYNTSDVRVIFDRFEKSGGDFIVTTLKDTVKLEKIWNCGCPLYYLDIRIEMENEDGFFRLIGK